MLPQGTQAKAEADVARALGVTPGAICKRQKVIEEIVKALVKPEDLTRQSDFGETKAIG